MLGMWWAELLNTILASLSKNVPPFSPSDITGLKAWYDASDTATISLSGSAVTQWNDKSGNAFNLTQSTGANRPTSGVNTINSKNVLDFDGNDYLQASTASNWKFLHDTSGSTVFFVAYYGSTSDYEAHYATSGGAATAVGTLNYKTNGDIMGCVMVRGVAGTYVVDANNGTISDNANHQISYAMDPNNGTAANRAKYRIDKTAQTQGNSQTGAPSTADPEFALRLGTYDTVTSWGFSGKIAEVIMYTGLLSDGDITSVQDYITSKWGI